MVVLDLKSRNTGAQSLKDIQQRPELEETDGQQPSSAPGTGHIEVVSALLAAVQQKILAGDSYKDLAAEVDNIQGRLKRDSGGEILQQSSVEMLAILESFRERLQEANRETAIEFKRILSLVNESFGCIQAGDEKADERLKYLEKSLREATKMDSLISLRRHLTGMLDFVRKEGKLELAAKESRVQLAEQVQQAQQAGVRLHVPMPGRLEAFKYMQGLLAASSGKADAQVSLFMVDTLKALRARHGDVIAGNILEELGRRQVQPLAPEGKLYCWSASSLVLIARPKTSGNSAGLLCAVPSTFEHRAFTGTRVATFQVNVRSISRSLSGGLEEVTATLDRFSKESSS